MKDSKSLKNVLEQIQSNNYINKQNFQKIQKFELHYRMSDLDEMQLIIRSFQNVQQVCWENKYKRV